MRNNDNLRAAIIGLIPERILSEIPETPDHVFSKRFERRMKTIIKSADNPSRIKNISIKRIFVAVLAAVLALLVMAMSVTAIREAFINFFTELFSTHTVVQSVTDNSAPTTFEVLYVITEGIENHTLIDHIETPTDIIYIYDNEQSQIRFKQTLKGFYDVNVNSEGYELERIFINGKEGYYIDMTDQSSKYLSWDNGDYIMTVTAVIKASNCNIDKNTLIFIAESVQKVE